MSGDDGKDLRVLAEDRQLQSQKGPITQRGMLISGAKVVLIITADDSIFFVVVIDF